MQDFSEKTLLNNIEGLPGDIFVVLSATGFENSARARSALMFATLAAAANYRSILYCIQNAVDILVKGAVEKKEEVTPGTPTLAHRLSEALDAGVEIQCCTQTMSNKKLTKADLIYGVKEAGAMTLIDLVSSAKGSLCF